MIGNDANGMNDGLMIYFGKLAMGDKGEKVDDLQRITDVMKSWKHATEEEFLMAPIQYVAISLSSLVLIELLAVRSKQVCFGNSFTFSTLNYKTRELQLQQLLNKNRKHQNQRHQDSSLLFLFK